MLLTIRQEKLLQLLQVRLFFITIVIGDTKT